MSLNLRTALNIATTHLFNLVNYYVFCKLLVINEIFALPTNLVRLFPLWEIFAEFGNKNVTLRDFLFEGQDLLL